MLKINYEPVDGVIYGYEETDKKRYKTDLLVDIIDFFSKYTIDDVVSHKLRINSDGDIEKIPITNTESDPYFVRITEKRDQLVQKQNEYNALQDQETSIASLSENGETQSEKESQMSEIYSEMMSIINDIHIMEMEYDERLTEYKKEKYSELDSSITPLYYSSLCLLIKNENIYLNEWLTYHLPLVDHIYIYDNGDQENVQTVVDTFSEDYKNKITIVLFNDSYEDLQTEAYNHFLKNYGEQTRWVSFIDSDEFIELDSDMSINDILREKTSFTEVQLKFVEYNANGLINYENKPVRERFVTECNTYAYLYHKEFVQPVRVDHMSTHYPIYEDIDNKYIDDTKSLFHISHYYTKSYEEWKMKMNRGSSDPNCLKKFDEFFLYNSDLLYLRDEENNKNQGYNA